MRATPAKVFCTRIEIIVCTTYYMPVLVSNECIYFIAGMKKQFDTRVKQANRNENESFILIEIDIHFNWMILIYLARKRTAEVTIYWIWWAPTKTTTTKKCRNESTSTRWTLQMANECIWLYSKFGIVCRMASVVHFRATDIFFLNDVIDGQKVSSLQWLHTIFFFFFSSLPKRSIGRIF